MSFSKPVKLIRPGNSNHLIDTKSSTEQNLSFAELAQDFYSFIILLIWCWGRSKKRLLQFVYSWKNRRFHFVKSVRIRSFPGPNAGRYVPEKFRIRTLFTQCSTNCLRADWEFISWIFLENSNANKSFLVFSIHRCSWFVIHGCSIHVRPKFHQWLCLGALIHSLFLPVYHCSKS